MSNWAMVRRSMTDVRKPPPPPPHLHRPVVSQSATPAPEEGFGGVASAPSGNRIAEMALHLLEEQVQARIVHYRSDLATNPELDAITDQIVRELREMQAAQPQARRSSESEETVAAALEATLRKLLERVFSANTSSMFIERRLRAMQRKLARLFFESELHEKTRGSEGGTKTIQHGEQAVFYVLSRYQHRLQNELQGFEYANEDAQERAQHLLAHFTKEMQDGFLSRRSSELKRIATVFNTVLLDFFTVHLPPLIPSLAREVIAQSRGSEGRAYSYKITAAGFSRFRSAFERRFMVRLVGYTEDELVTRLANTAGEAREQTIRFITDPQIFSAICGELTSGIYEYLCNEGFLDLPRDWRAAHAEAG